MKYTPTFWIDAAYALNIPSPMDTRSVVASKNDLLTADTWTLADGTCIAYNGMLVGVADSSDPESSGLYYLFDEECTSTLMSPTTTNESNWIKLCSVAQLNTLSSKISEIQDNLSGITADIETLKSDVSSIKTDINNMDARIDELEIFPDMICGGNSEA